MTSHLLKYSFKTYLQNKLNLVWNFIFPFAYIGIFFLAMFSLSRGDMVSIRLAIVLPEAKLEESIARIDELESFFLAAGGKISSSVEDSDSLAQEQKSLIIYLKAKEEEAIRWLKEDKIDALIHVRPELEYVVKPGRPLAATIAKEILSVFNRLDKIEDKVGDLYKKGLILVEGQEFARSNFLGLDKSQRPKSIDPQFIYFIASLAYVAYFPIASGLDAVESIEPGQSLGARRKAVSPLSKQKLFLAALLPRLFSHLLLTILLYAFTQLLGIDYGPLHGQIILLLLLGTTAAVFTGTVIAALLPARQGIRLSLAIGLPLLFAVASGMMASPVHSLIMEHLPWLHNFNPLGLITNGLYALSAGGDIARYSLQIKLLAAFDIFCLSLTLIAIRRTVYESV